MRKARSLFSRLMFSVAAPEVVIFSIVAIISYFQLKDLFHEISNEKIDNFQDELMSIIKFQDVSLGQISKTIDHSTQDKMKRLRYEYFLSSDSIETADLNRIRKEIGMSNKADIYIISKEGFVVNTTFEADKGLNMFSFSEDFTDFLKDMFTHDFYTPEPMTMERATRKFRKFIYQSSKDHEYIIQMGFYSSDADEFMREIPKRLKEIEKAENDIVSIDLILAPWDPISYYSRKIITDEERELVLDIFKDKSTVNLEEEDETIRYIYFEREDIEIITSGILKVIYDNRRNQEILMLNFLHKVSLFGLGIGILFLILYMNVKTVVRPIHNLSKTAQKLGDGQLNERAVAEGSKEIIFLANSFNKMADNLEKSHKEITKKNDEILASINYAKRIQEAILPEVELVKQNLKDVFVYYQPKDIVAGDFYWYEKIGDDVYIASADCTGHGVPGAMVSVVCSNSLYKAIREKKLTDPAEILNETRVQVIETFEQSQHDVKDGMDICFCKINVKKRLVTYAGAQNSLYRITNKEGDDETGKRIEDDEHMLVEYKADKQPIGKFTAEKPFTSHEIQCLEGDSIYLFSDGYPDQFGGPNGRKFMYKPFKRLLLSIKDRSMEEQKEVLRDKFNDWKKDMEQIDDVCVIGIRL